LDTFQPGTDSVRKKHDAFLERAPDQIWFRLTIVPRVGWVELSVGWVELLRPGKNFV
jgi:hypothetical protein